MELSALQTVLAIMAVMAGAVIWICKSLVTPISQRLDQVVETLKDMRQDYRDGREERVSIVKQLAVQDRRITEAHQRLDHHDTRIESLEHERG